MNDKPTNKSFMDNFSDAFIMTIMGLSAICIVIGSILVVVRFVLP